MIGGKQSAPLLRSLLHQGRHHHFVNELPGDCRLIRVVHKCITWEETCSPLTHFQQVNLRTIILQTKDGRTTANLGACWNLQTLYMEVYNYVRTTPPFEICKRTSDRLLVVYKYVPVILPFEIWEMPQLRHLHLIGPGVCVSDPVVVEGSKQEECIVLQNLHTLEGVVNLRLTEEVCKRIPNLERLRVKYEEFRGDYCFQNVGRFNKLKKLGIYIGSDSKWCDVDQDLTFPASLEELYLYNGQLKWEDLTMMLTSLPHLELLELAGICGSEWNLEEEEEFRCLKRLEIRDCNDLIYLNANSSHFPSLESLSLSNIHRLNEIPLDIGEISTLKLIELSGCSAFVAFSAMRMVIEQETFENHIQLYVSFWARGEFEFEGFKEMLREEHVNSNNLHLNYDGKKIKIF